MCPYFSLWYHVKHSFLRSWIHMISIINGRHWLHMGSIYLHISTYGYTCSHMAASDALMATYICIWPHMATYDCALIFLLDISMGVLGGNLLLYSNPQQTSTPHFDRVLIDGSFLKMVAMSVAASAQDHLYANVSTHILYQDIIFRAAIIAKGKLAPLLNYPITLYIDNHAPLVHHISLPTSTLYEQIISSLYVPNLSIKSQTWDKRAHGSKITLTFSDHVETMYDSQFRELLRTYRANPPPDDRDWRVMENYLVCNPFVNNYFPPGLTKLFVNILSRILPSMQIYLSNTETDFEIIRYVSAHPHERICIVSGDTDYSFWTGYSPNVYIYDLHSFKHPFTAWSNILPHDLITPAYLARISYLMGNDYFPGFVRDPADLPCALNLNQSFSQCGENGRKTIAALYNQTTKCLVKHKVPFTAQELDMIILSGCSDTSQRQAYVTSLMVITHIDEVVTTEAASLVLTDAQMCTMLKDTLRSNFPMLFQFKHSPPTLIDMIGRRFAE